MRERAGDWLHEAGVNEEDILLSNSEEESDSELSGLTSDFDTIEGVIEEAAEAIDPEIEEGNHEVTEEVIEVCLVVLHTISNSSGFLIG
jgi:hypothetical protein